MWADIAPEALALIMGLLRANDVTPSVIESGVNIGRDSDTIAAMAGAVAGALHGASAFDPAHIDQVRSVPGQCIRVHGGHRPHRAGRRAGRARGSRQGGTRRAGTR